MFFDIFNDLCIKKGVSCKRAAEDIGLSNSITTKWKKTGATPTGETLSRIAAYFNVSVGYLLGEENKKAPTTSGERSVSDDDIKFALFGGDGEITDAMYQEVKEFAALIKLREDMKKSKE